MAPARPPPLTFAVASCQYPGGMADRSPTPIGAGVGLSDIALERLAQENPSPSFFIIAGDQVYMDATAGLFDARSLDDIGGTAYAALRDNPGRMAALKNTLARYVILDDHEIYDNWEPVPGLPLAGALKERLVDGAERYAAASRNGPLAIRRPYQAGDPLWFTFVESEYAFFMADTRTDRGGRDATNLYAATIVSPDQWQQLTDWMARTDPSTPAFVVSPSMVLPRALEVARNGDAALRSQSWDGYPRSLHDLLAWLYENQRSNFVFLSGDAHLSVAARFTITADDGRRPIVGHSIHSSALYAPYPFANAVEDDFTRVDTFEFGSAVTNTGRRYRCEVKAYFPRLGDGYALLTAMTTQETWQVEVAFSGNLSPATRRQITLRP